MEKYRSTADPSTGLHPYLPPPSAPTPFLTRLLSPIVFLLRLPKLIFCLLLSPLFLLPRCAPTRLLHSFLSTLLLSALSLPPHPAPTPLHRNSKTPCPPPGPADLLLVNLHGPLTILHLTAHYTPTFLFPTSTGLTPISFPTLLTLLSTGSLPPTLPQPPVSNLPSFLSASPTPTVLLAEGAVTNGRGVLAFPAHTRVALATLPASVRILALGYAPHPGATYCGVGSWPAYIMSVMARVKTSLAATYRVIPRTEVANAQAVLAQCAKIPPMAVARDGRPDFDRHWREAGGMSK